eukprot:TRINITY_DN3223_c1_g4_i1.p2 TRINITY_DN3223_c1_g4~~TRINITY_DN3223_c1_g4_i1.p2  ORF type:complete len:244 (-),score=36.13 TRINITY_DN3223_c1_g4_i1:70-801(-)
MADVPMAQGPSGQLPEVRRPLFAGADLLTLSNLLLPSALPPADRKQPPQHRDPARPANRARSAKQRPSTQQHPAPTNSTKTAASLAVVTPPKKTFLLPLQSQLKNKVHRFSEESAPQSSASVARDRRAKLRRASQYSEWVRSHGKYRVTEGRVIERYAYESEPEEDEEEVPNEDPLVEDRLAAAPEFRPADPLPQRLDEDFGDSRDIFQIKRDAVRLVNSLLRLSSSETEEKWNGCKLPNVIR